MTAESELARPADIPSLDRLLNHAAFAHLLATYGRAQVTAALRNELKELRRRSVAAELKSGSLVPDAVAGKVSSCLAHRSRPQLRPVFNLTGTVLHTNLGRAVLPDMAVDSVVRALMAPVNLEFDLQSGARGDRDDLVETLLCELTGAEAATVVNNNAAAVLLVLNTLAKRREVIVSRGELVEIGGSFRIPDVMRSAGAALIEVGTTNRTHASDYSDAIGRRTALLMKVHTSNYAISGFTASVGLADLAALGRARGLPVGMDLGSGSLIDLGLFGLPKEPTVRDAVAAGADLVSFSGDKLLGGPQAGIIVGRADLIRRLKKNPLKRALRVGKLTLAALEPILTLYRSPELLAHRLTTLRLLTRNAASIEAQTCRLLPNVQTALGELYAVTASPMNSQIGSGALPVDQLPSYGFRVTKTAGKRGSLARLEEKLRELARPILGRFSEKALWLDLRCLDAEDEAEFAAQWSSFDR
ncbi:MAG TPA: L-seryl-tRNA(Sec) selenium transferase [Steroidobacteraceae bacterium]|jgi:L-seryl-tRNA(Ser) seleniumtransferase|nr:L-seryl-tRNA(Sec) selenium transferase [Steroidobacteraceae bacterium]